MNHTGYIMDQIDYAAHFPTATKALRFAAVATAGFANFETTFMVTGACVVWRDLANRDDMYDDMVADYDGIIVSESAKV